MGKAQATIRSSINERAANFKLTIDLRGKKAEEALNILQKYIDDAILLSAREVSILHGKGDGILRQVVRNFLAGHDNVESFRDAHIERGGSGITEVVFKNGS
jgi:DNA mismatch repair protein MutS2